MVMAGGNIGAIAMQEILQYLKNNGERLDSEIAAATGLSLAIVRRGMSDLSARGDVMMCRSIRFKDGKQIDGMLCRVSGYIPPAAPGRKSKAQKA
jgi:hypothetical protein